jgi:DNA ligase-1
MKRFIQLIEEMADTTKTNTKVEYLTKYFAEIDKGSAIWAIFFLFGKRIKRGVNYNLLTEIALEMVDIPEWLFFECLTAVGDRSEALSLLIELPETQSKIEHNLQYWVEKRFIPLQKMTHDQQKKAIKEFWSECNRKEIFVINKLISGGFYGRIGVSKGIVLRALEKFSEVPQNTLQYRLMGNWEPTINFYDSLISTDTTDADLSQPYPFFLASPLLDSLESLGNLKDWIFEHKWDGIRSQTIVRNKKIFIWSRGEEIVTESFPEIVVDLQKLPNGTVIDGELLAYHNNEPLAFSVLQRRIGRIGKNISKKILSEAPVRLMAYDLLEFEGKDIRETPISERRRLLVNLLKNIKTNILFSKELEAKTWDEVQILRENARKFQAEGLVIKRKDSSYQSGRKRGDWWKFKVDPLSLDVVMVYVQAGSGKRANFFTDYTFAVWSSDKSELIPIGKSYRGLTDDEIKELDAWIRKNTNEKFGPVRSVKPEQIFELGFDNVLENKRVKAGISVRFPRIIKWRRDKTIEEINTIDDAKELLKFTGKTEIKLKGKTKTKSLNSFL